MDFVALTQRLKELSGSSGTALTTVQSLTGQNLRLKNWINESWNEIQTLNDSWKWMRQSYVLGQNTVPGTTGCSFATVSGQYSYPLGSGAGKTGVTVATFGRWDPYAFRAYTTSVTTKADETPLVFMGYDQWRDTYLISSLRSVTTRPYVVTIGPDMSVCLGPPPNALYTVEGDYWIKPSLMSANADVPTGLPTEYHMAIVYKALDKYAQYASAPEAAGAAKKGYIPLIYKLSRNYAPRFTMAGQ